ncbi:MAG TPA: inorganic phosphate transporter [Kofleriaceae bacterium]|nr:inorganic phosphate transporter [Kofleriaceae bacterium]
MELTGIVIFAIGLALAFDIVNGFHDAANSIATVVSTQVLSPRVAVLWAAFFNFVALVIFGEGVAKTISGIVNIDAGDKAFIYVVLAGLVGAIIWNLLTWWWGLPSSSSHALIGGLAGAGVTHAGWDVLVKEKIYKTIWFIPLAPLIGFILAFSIMILLFWIFKRARPGSVDKWFRVGQLISSAAYSIGHGGNDAQKTMGIIVALLVASGQMDKNFTEVPMWIAIASYGCMALGTSMGGWRIIKTMGMRLTKLRPEGGFCAEMAGAITLFGATHLHIPVSTTHTITGAIIGVGTTTKARGIKWGLASRIVWAWIFTIPASAAMAAITFAIMRYFQLW